MKYIRIIHKIYRELLKNIINKIKNLYSYCLSQSVNVFNFINDNVFIISTYHFEVRKVAKKTSVIFRQQKFFLLLNKLISFLELLPLQP